MAYATSSLDLRLKKWFKNDNTSATLHRIKLRGQLRSLKNIEIEFDYPISAFAGKNGCGKTTVLALSACAYHNDKKGYKLKSKKQTYYTFSDFFIQTQEEIKPDGISIWYTFLHNHWRNLIPGFGIQLMRKRKGGKWTNYDKRVRKNVIYLGIDRVVPQTEKKVYKSYIKYFTDATDGGWYADVQKYVGRILGKNYSDFKVKNAGAYNLQLVKETGVVYSGFNMGAGEKALFELFSVIHECALMSQKALIIIDEIELGLHEVAQRNLMNILKEVCDKYKIQIICTTHSPAILDSLPPEGRFYIDKIGDEVEITKGISGAFAAGRLSEKNSNELNVFVEDDVAVELLKASLKIDVRQRIQIVPIGSYSAVCRQLAAAYQHPQLKKNSIAVIDGDQRNNQSQLITKMKGELELSTDAEKTKFNDWIKDKILFLPGNTNPEKWIVAESLKYIETNFARQLGVPLKLLKQELTVANSQLAHQEFYYLSQKLSLTEDSLLRDFSRLIEINDTGNLK